MLSTLRKSKPLVVVWAGGYEANSIPILDNLGNEVQIVKDSRGQYITDNFSQLQFLKNKVSDDANKLTISNRCSTTGGPTSKNSNDNNSNKVKIETYYNYIDDFIAADRDGATVDVEGEDFNNVIHEQYNALFTGLEVSGQYGVTKIDDFDLISSFMVDFLKGYRTSNDKAI